VNSLIDVIGIAMTNPQNSHNYGVYVHVPWCKSRCPYCSFNVYVARSPAYSSWRDGILRDWGLVEGTFKGRPHSVYFGGGTPSLAPPEIIGSILSRLPLDSRTEITLEVNPGSVSEGRLTEFISTGVNRLSLGVQTFNARLAHMLGRGHTSEHAYQLVNTVQKMPLRSWSIDLIFGLPDQTMADLRADLEEILRLSPPHLSLYGLTIKPGTPFATAERKGTLILPDDAAWRRQYDLIVETLENNGWQRYEVSNFAKPGHRAVHNERVWRGGHYAGLGPGAHGFHPNGNRTVMKMGLKDWLNEPFEIQAPTTPKEAAVDYVLTTIRHADGIDHKTLKNSFGYVVDLNVLDLLIAERLVVVTDDNIRLCYSGWPLSDAITRTLVAGLQAIGETNHPTA